MRDDLYDFVASFPELPTWADVLVVLVPLVVMVVLLRGIESRRRHDAELDRRIRDRYTVR